MKTYNNSVVLRNDGIDPSTTNADLNAATGVNITVRVASSPVAGEGALASIFNVADVAIANPMQTDNQGNYTFKVVDGFYDIVIAEGTADETTLAAEDISGIIDNLSLPYVFDTVAAMIVSPLLPVEKLAIVNEYYVGGGGGASWGVVAAGTYPVSAYVLNHASQPIQFVLETQPVMYASQFGIKFDNSDETAIFIDMLNFQIATGVILNGENKPIRIAGRNDLAPTFKTVWEDFKFIAGNDYTDQPMLFFTTDVDYDLQFSVDGERDTRTTGTEPWTVSTTFNGVESIEPLVTNTASAFLRINEFNTKEININVIAKNCHYREVVFINSYGNVNVHSFKAENCTFRQYAIWHSATALSDPETGVTNATKLDSRDCGIMSAAFLVDGVSKLRSDNYAPQGAFGFLVTFGTYLVNNVNVNNYGATGLTGDRNKVFEWSNVNIIHTDPNAFNNNPSGAMWNEQCSREIGSGLNVKVTARDPRETAFDNSLLQTFLGNGELSFLTGVILETEAGANMSKIVRGSLSTDSQFTINGFSIEATDSTNSIVIQNGAGLSNKIALYNGRTRGAPSVLRDSLDNILDNVDTDNTLTFQTANGAAPIGNVTLDNVKAGDTTINACGGNINITSSRLANIRMVSGFSSSFLSMDVGGGTELYGSNSIITGGKRCKFGDVETSRRIEFVDIETVSVKAGTYKTDLGESIINFIPTGAGIMQQATIMGCDLWIKTGTGGAGYVNSNANVVNFTDLNNSKLNVAWT